MAGLTAAWHLDKRGFRDFVLLEMEPEAGGNSRWGENEITAYPWAAHYVPVPGKHLTLVRELMEDLGVLREGKWEERWLCHTPQERVFRHGRWQEGFEPESREERSEWKRFEAKMAGFASSGEFTIPLPDHSKLNALDRISMHDWLDANGFRSAYLRWYVDYACRDDYGAHAAGTSAHRLTWAFITSRRARPTIAVRSPGPKAMAGSRDASSTVLKSASVAINPCFTSCPTAGI
jgi:phytoene dehydrogenase-like protein